MTSPDFDGPTVSMTPQLAAEPELASGQLIGRYVVVDTLGRGGMGTVYRAYDTQINRTLAIKVLHRSLAKSEAADAIGARMLREAQAMARLRHPNVVVIHDVGMVDGSVFLGMEYVDGGTLRTWLAGDRSLDERLAVLVAAGRGLAAAHAAGLVHRDFKPDNVLVGGDGRVLVTDFGIARIADEAPPPSTPVATVIEAPPASQRTFGDLTQTGSVLGTMGYMAPEQAEGLASNAASDQFSFCVTAYFALYGVRPFPATDLFTYLEEVHAPLPPPPPGNAVPAWIHKVLARGLSPSPADRFPSMDALLAALQADPAIARRRGWTTAAAIAAALLVASTAVVASTRRSEECTPSPADLKGVWDDTIKADVAASFARSGAPGASDVASRVVRVLDDTASKWTAMKAESCEATRIKRRQPEDEFRLRGECLDRRRDELRALSSSLRTSDPSVVGKALSASYGLTNVAVCADVPMLRRSGGLPDDPASRARVQEARAGLARARSLQLVGKLEDATREVDAALAIARASAHATTIAEALQILGGLKVETNEHAQAEAVLTEATWTASRAGADALVVNSASLAAFVVGSKLGRPGEARIWLGVAEAALARVGASQELELELEEHKAWILADSDGRAEEALPIQERIARVYGELYGVHPRTLRALYNLGDAETAIGEHARACDVYARAIAMGESIGGPKYEWVGYASAGLGDCLAARGDYVGGDQAFERAVSIFRSTDDDYSEAEVLEAVIRAALARGDDARAIEVSRHALDLMKGIEGTASLAPLVYVPAAEALLRAPAGSMPGPAEAEALCVEAERQQEQLGQVDPAKILRADALRCLGEARIAAGRPRDAIAPLERSIAIPRRTYPGDLARARFDLARALVLGGGDRARAMSLADEARRELAGLPWLAADRDAVDRWLATTR